MIRAGTLCLLLLGLSLPALADAGKNACPPANLSAPLPGASEVTLQTTDVSTARFSGTWQIGRFGKEGQLYRLFQDGTGSVIQDARLRGWHVDFACDVRKKRCSYGKAGDAPKQALDTAKAIGDCLIAKPPVRGAVASPADPKADRKPKPVVAAEKTAPIKPTVIVASNKTDAAAKVVEVGPTAVVKGAVKATKSGSDSTKAKPEKDSLSTKGALAVHDDSKGAPKSKAPAYGTTPAPSCWADHLPIEPEVSRLQRMLLLAGKDPGRIDGLFGRRTAHALTQALGAASDASASMETLHKLRNLLCLNVTGTAD